MKNRIEDVIVGVILVLAALLSGVILSRIDGRFEHGGQQGARRDTVVVVDTIFIDRPIVRDSIIVKTVTRWLTRVDTVTRCDTIRLTDSVLVEVPIEQRRYEGNDYRAWISGYEPRLDSIEIYRRERTITIQPRRWSVGFQAGYGLTTKGLGGYAGVGVTYRLY